MSTAEQQIQVHVERFVSELTALVRQAALEQVSQAFGAPQVTKRRGPGRPAASSLAAPKKAKNGGRVRRSPEQLAAVSKAIAKFVSSNQGVRVEEISASLGLPTKELAGPIKDLLAEKAISKKGDRRSTTYYGKK